MHSMTGVIHGPNFTYSYNIKSHLFAISKKNIGPNGKHNNAGYNRQDKQAGLHVHAYVCPQNYTYK